MEVSTTNIIINGLFALAGVLLGYLINVIREILVIRYNFKTEKLKLHDKAKIKAYQELFVFVRKLKKSVFPLAENKKESFINIVEREYNNKIDLNYPYYSRKIMSKLDKIEEMYICSTSPELIFEVDVSSFMENELFSLLIELERMMKKIFKDY